MLSLEGSTERHLIVPAAPQEVAAFFSQNEALLRQLVGTERVIALGGNRYRIETRRFEALGLAVTPCFDVRFEDLPDRTLMRSEACRPLSSSHLDLAMEAEFQGEARFTPHDEGTLLECRTEAQVRLQPPRALRLTPTFVLRGLGNALLNTAMEALSSRFVPLFAEEFGRWLSQSRRATL